jgi:hypothetical protein
MRETSTKRMGRFHRLIVRISLVVTVIGLLPIAGAQASQITSRSLTLGSSQSAVTSTTHTYRFTVPSSTAIRSVRFRYCTTASGACTVPGSWVNTSATLGSTTNLGTGFTVDLATNSDSVGVTSTTNATAPGTPITIPINTVHNPTSPGQPFSWFVRISTYSDAAYATPIDTGTVMAALNTQIVLTGTMPESLVFCTGGIITGTDCTTATSGAISFNQDFSPTATAITTNQMVASTNAGFGYAITVNGTTMTSGASTITGMTTATTSSFGVSQFGLNVAVNTTPAVGAAIAPASNTTNYRGQGFTGYGTADTFKFTTGDTVADSGNSTLGPTDSQNYTVSYLVNVPGSQAAGTYTTTLTYICTATF